jgi:hypothetical protein
MDGSPCVNLYIRRHDFRTAFSYVRWAYQTSHFRPSLCPHSQLTATSTGHAGRSAVLLFIS